MNAPVSRRCNTAIRAATPAYGARRDNALLTGAQHGTRDIRSVAAGEAPPHLHPPRSKQRRRSGQAGMRAPATARLRVRTDYFAPPRPHILLERVLAALRGADERPRRALVHVTIIGVAFASALASVCFNV